MTKKQEQTIRAALGNIMIFVANHQDRMPGLMRVDAEAVSDMARQALILIDRYQSEKS